MRFRIILLGILFMGLFSIFGAKADTREKQLQQIFNEVKKNTDWNMDGKLLWGYFFNDPQESKLLPLADYLKQNGYTVVSTYPADGDVDSYFLHVEKIEHHTVASLNQRENELRELAKKFGVESYDGMDVGQVEK